MGVTPVGQAVPIGTDEVPSRRRDCRRRQREQLPPSTPTQPARRPLPRAEPATLGPAPTDPNRLAHPSRPPAGRARRARRRPRRPDRQAARSARRAPPAPSHAVARRADPEGPPTHRSRLRATQPHCRRSAPSVGPQAPTHLSGRPEAPRCVDLGRPPRPAAPLRLCRGGTRPGEDPRRRPRLRARPRSAGATITGCLSNPGQRRTRTRPPPR